MFPYFVAFVFLAYYNMDVIFPFYVMMIDSLFYYDFYLKVYLLAVFLSFVSKIYMSGRNALIRFRRGITPNTQITSELEACRHGCSDRITENFFDSFIFPVSWLSDIMPIFILKTNPRGS